MRLRKKIFLFREFLKKTRIRLNLINNTLIVVASVIGFLLMLYDIGFEKPISLKYLISFTYTVLFQILTLSYFLKIVFAYKNRISKTALFIEFLTTIVLVLYVISFYVSKYNYDVFYFNFLFQNVFTSQFFVYALLIFLFSMEVSKGSLLLFKKQFNPFKLFIFSYIVLTTIGAALLLLPNSTTNGISITDALFTSTSAVCVTGLIVVDTATAFTTTGQTIILVLFQLGGLGFMTFTSFFVLFSDNKFSIQNQFFLRNIVNENNTSQILKTIFKIIVFSLTFEIIGTILIYNSISDVAYFSDFKQKFFYSAFHAVSAFCNAGFSTSTDGLYHITTRFNYNMHLIIAILIIIGGLGFPILFNFYKYLKYHFQNIIRRQMRKENFHHFPRLINVNSKIVLVTTGLLLVIGFAWFYFAESQNTLEGKSLYGKIVTAFFCSVTPRTAGFNTIDYTTLTLPSILFCVFLMWVGASPNSTGGGIKTSAFALGILNIFSIAKGKNRIEINKRKISDESLRNAFAVIVLSIFIILVSFILITMFDSHLSLKNILFECVSAFSTVGLSLGATNQISDSSKIVLVFTMLIGRVGSLTIILAFISKVKSLNYTYPSENIII
jgi:trk system potassium uptake protein